MSEVPLEALSSLESQDETLYTTLETAQGQMDGFFGQLPFKCHLEEVASVGD